MRLNPPDLVGRGDPFTLRRLNENSGGLFIPPPTMNFNFMTGALDPLIAFTRASSATYIDSNGILQTAGVNVPRFDYGDPSTPQLKGFYGENAATNLALWSNDFTNIVWVKVGITAAMTATGPDNVVNSASTLTATLNNGTALQSIISASSARVFSLWMRRRTGTGGVDITQSGGTTWTPVILTSAWTKVAVPGATITNPVVGVRVQVSGDAVDIYCAQSEVGGFASSSIVTTTATVTRANDVADITGTNFSNFYNASESTVALSVIFEGTAGANGSCFAINNSGSPTTNTLWLGSGSTANSGRSQMLTGGTVQIDGSVNNASTLNVLQKMAAGVKTNDGAVYMNGTLGAIDTSITMPVVNQLRLWRGQSVVNSGWLQYVKYWNQKLTNAQIQALSI